MKLADTLSLSLHSLVSARTRSLLIVLAMALGVGAVVVLTALGEGARRYVVGQFASLGTNLVIVLPGRAETTGGFPGAALGQTPRDLTLGDAQAVGQLPGVRRYAPLNVGTAELSSGGRLREVTVLGSNAELLPIRRKAGLPAARRRLCSAAPLRRISSPTATPSASACAWVTGVSAWPAC